MKNVLIFALLFTLAAGCDSRDDSINDKEHKIFIFADLSISEIHQIIIEIQRIDSGPILMIKDENRGGVEIEVHTGVVKGPLDGGGKSYLLHFKNNKWVIVKTGFWVS